MPRLAPLLCLALLGCADYPPLVERGDAPDVLVVRDVRLFDGRSPTSVDGMDVVVEGGRIAAVRPTGQPVPAGARVVEGRGRTLLPGLIDLHVHLTSTSSPPWRPELPDVRHNLEAFLAAGVTTVLDLGGALDEIDAIALRVEEGRWLGPRIYRAGPIVTARGGHPAALLDDIAFWPASAVIAGRLTAQVDSPADAARVVEGLARRGVDVIKVAYDETPPGAPKLTRRHLLAIVETAHAHGLPVLAHVRTAADALTCALYGVDALAHGVVASRLEPEVADAIGRTGVAVVPTLVNPTVFVEMAGGRFRPTALERAIENPAILDSIVSGPDRVRAVGPGFAAFLDEIAAHEADWGPNTLALHEAGVPILAGTDSVMFGDIPGASLHRELALQVRAGIPAGEVLLGATSRAMALLAPGSGLGRIEPGAPADLLLVEGDPLADLGALERIAGLWKGGVEVGRIR